MFKKIYEYFSKIKITPVVSMPHFMYLEQPYKYEMLYARNSKKEQEIIEKTN